MINPENPGPRFLYSYQDRMGFGKKAAALPRLAFLGDFD